MAGAKIRVKAAVRENRPGDISAVAYYRLGQPLSYARERSKKIDVKMISQFGVIELQNNFHQSNVEDYLLDCDVFAVSRLYGRRLLQEYVDAFHSVGAIIIFDTDDDLTDEFREIGRGDEFIYTIKKMDLVTVSTPFLAKRLSSYIGYTPVVLPNHIDIPFFSNTSFNARRTVPGLSIGFMGTKSHDPDWHFPVEAIKRLLSEGYKFTPVTIGHAPDYLMEIPGILVLEGMPYDHYPTLVRQLDIVLCSLDTEDIFNHSKSAVKALEAMASARSVGKKIGGAVPVCTNIPVYNRVVQNRNNGLIVNNDEWYSALKLLIEDSNLRNKLSLQGYKWVNKNRNISNGWKLWENVYVRAARGLYNH